MENLEAYTPLTCFRQCRELRGNYKLISSSVNDRFLVQILLTGCRFLSADWCHKKLESSIMFKFYLNIIKITNISVVKIINLAIYCHMMPESRNSEVRIDVYC
jgi:hypothetical protein